MPTTTRTDDETRALYVDALRLQLGRLEREAYGTPLHSRVAKAVALFEEIEGRRPVAVVRAELETVIAEAKTCAHHSV
jgi:hypothetical protein